MPHLDEVAATNQRFWESEVSRGAGYTRPWLELDPELVRAFAAGEAGALPEPYAYIHPRWIFHDVAEATAAGRPKDVLLLATGGGQQSAIFGLLGASVTVFDLTNGQLAGDRLASERYGYPVRTIQGDMRDLSILADRSFDLVYQAVGIIYVPDVRPVYREAARVLRPGGLYRVGHCEPVTQCVWYDSWDGSGYRISVPFARGLVADPDGVSMEYRHLLSDAFNGLIEAGLSIRGVSEDPRHLLPTTAEAGTYEHLLTWGQIYYDIVAAK
jgi:ubiquinone/menaquinone biosynthesis C-methylase UbiE